MSKIEADWLRSSATQRVFSMLSDGGFQALAVGGCVRNALLDAPVKDIDLSTDATPETVTNLAKDAGFKVIPTGVEHGTVTVIVADTPFEITTFRRDVATDGRRAVVAFSDDIEDDARRRDFTMNAIYADANGQIIDPLNGLPDLKARRLRFIEDADQRIREDYLRSLRFFRFHAWYGDQTQGFDTEALDAIARNVDGIASLSKERVGSEILRLLEAPEPTMAVAGMRTTGVLMAALEGADDKFLGPLIHLETQLEIAPDPLRRLAVLGGEDVSTRLRLSRQDSKRLDELRSVANAPQVDGYHFGLETGRDRQLIFAASMGAPIAANVLEDVRFGAAQTFPIKAADLMPRLSGPALGAMLKRLENVWIESGFSLPRDALIAMGDDNPRELD